MSHKNPMLFLGVFAILAASCTGTGVSPTRQLPASTETSSETGAGYTRLATATPENSTEAPAGWRTASPESQGMDSNLLAEIFPTIEEEGTNLHSLMIMRNGSVILEAYFPPHHADRKHLMFSITKSFMTTLTGIALERGYLESVDQRIIDLLPDSTFDNPDPRKEQITLEDVLTMTSGLGWEEIDPTFAELYSREDWVAYVLGKPMLADPGSQFSYCSGCSHILSAVLESTTGQDLLEFAQNNLFEPLAISDLNWETDQGGMPVGGWGLELTTRDMAKLGILYLQRGRWNETQIVPAEWLEAAVEYHADTGDGVGYGYQWWIYPEYGAYAAFGRGGQTVFVVPEQELIIATTAEIQNHDPILDLIDNFILPAIRSDQALPPNPEGEKILQAIVDQLTQP